MNEKIKELAVQAGAEYYGTRNTGEAMFGTLDVDLEKFAELIVQECATVAGGLHHVLPHQAELTSAVIKQHFGVK